MNHTRGLMICTDISKSFSEKNCRVEALKEMTFSIRQGEAVALAGRSGAGKTTLLNILAGLVRPDSGEYWFGDQKVSSLRGAGLLQFRREQIALIPQDLALIEEETVARNVALPLRLRHRSKRTCDKTVLEILEAVGISDKAQTQVSVLSGGEKQRVAAARALITDPAAILADEPTSALDEQGVEEIMNLLLEQHANGKTVIIVTHSPFVEQRCDRVLELDRGRIVQNG